MSTLCETQSPAVRSQVFTWSRRVVVTTSNPMEFEENDKFAVLVFGELRAYGFDAAESESGASLLLSLLSAEPAQYYQKISGFFNGVVFNKQTQTISLISDHIGSKPLYYQLANQDLLLTDSLDLLDASSLTISQQGIFNYCFYHCIAAPTTIYNEVFKLIAGGSIEINPDDSVVETLLYRPSYQYREDDLETQKKDCLKIIEQAVARYATQECGAFLSGGLDSSTVSGMLAKTASPAKTFSIGFESPQFDESEYANITAKHFNTAHHCHVMQPTTLIENFKQVAGYFDQPFGNSSAMAAYCCAMFAKEHGVDTLLAGDGGDEIFAGNERYAKQGVFEIFNQSPQFIQTGLESIFCKTPLSRAPIGSKAASYIRQAKVGLPDRLDSYNFLNRFSLEEIFSPQFLTQVDPQLPAKQKRERYQQADTSSHIERMLFLDWKFTLADNDLVKVSQMCDMAGVAVKYPLLEKEVIDFSCEIEDSDKLQGNKLRHFFKQSVSGFLPDQTITKPKHGFGLPFGLWMTESDELMAMAKCALEKLAKREIFNRSFIDLAIEKHQSEHVGYYGELIWILVVLELWFEARDL